MGELKLLPEVLLYSGGMDSLIAYEYLGRPPRLYVRLGHAYQASEMMNMALPPDLESPGGWNLPYVAGHLDLLAEDPTFIAIDDSLSLGSWEESDATIPARNLLLATVAARFTSTVWLVVQEDETSAPDRSAEFFQLASRTLTAALGRDVVVQSPFWEMDKADMVAWWLAEGKPQERLFRAWSCYRPRDGYGRECGDCPACIRKWIALVAGGCDADLAEPYFRVLPPSSPTADLYRTRARNKEFSPKRTVRTLEALGSEP